MIEAVASRLLSLSPDNSLSFLSENETGEDNNTPRFGTSDNMVSAKLGIGQKGRCKMIN